MRATATRAKNMSRALTFAPALRTLAIRGRVLDGDASALSAAVWAAEAAEVPVALARGWSQEAGAARGFGGMVENRINVNQRPDHAQDGASRWCGHKSERCTAQSQCIT